MNKNTRKNTRKNTHKNNKKGLRKTRSRRQRGGYFFGYGSKSEYAYIKDLSYVTQGYKQVPKEDKKMQENAIMHFINNVVPKYPDHPRQVILRNLSNLYVLMADSRDKIWEDIMTSTDYNTLRKRGKMIVAYMLLTETAEEKEYQKLKDMQNDEYEKPEYDNDENVVFIDWIDTIVRGINLASIIINKYESQHNDIMVLPEKILNNAVGFWADWLENKYGRYSDISEEDDLYNLYSGRNSITDEDGILQKKNIEELIENLKVNPDSLRWGSLFLRADGDGDNGMGMYKPSTIKQLKNSYKDTSDDEDEEDDEDNM